MARVALSTLLVFATACSGGNAFTDPSEASTTTTTAPLAEPSTTSTTVASTTTTAGQATTTTSNECTEQPDGTFMTAQRIVCPPYLVSFDGPEDLAFSVGHTYLPGTYRTRLFDPPLSFTHTAKFQSGGESTLVVSLHNGRGGRGLTGSQDVTVFGGELAAVFAHFHELPSNRGPDHVWATALTVTETSIGGLPATRIDSVTDCPKTPETPYRCETDIEPLGGWMLADEQHDAVFAVEQPGVKLTLLVSSPEPDFEEYWTEVAQPLLDSIAFVDQ